MALEFCQYPHASELDLKQDNEQLLLDVPGVFSEFLPFTPESVCDDALLSSETDVSFLSAGQDVEDGNLSVQVSDSSKDSLIHLNEVSQFPYDSLCEPPGASSFQDWTSCSASKKRYCLVRVEPGTDKQVLRPATADDIAELESVLSKGKFCSELYTDLSTCKRKRSFDSHRVKRAVRQRSEDTPELVPSHHHLTYNRACHQHQKPGGPCDHCGATGVTCLWIHACVTQFLELSRAHVVRLD